jgi:gliding motility-associated-like protein
MSYLLRLIFFLFIFPISQLVAQIVIDENITPQQLVEDILVGQGLDVFNIQFNSPQTRYGYFDSSNSNVGIEDGLVMSTRNVQIATCGPEVDGSGPGSDPDLAQIVSSNLNDVTILEFDFIPQGNEISFNYVFASTEYSSWVCTQYNDVFGFFISGPGINGPFSNNGINIAVLPDGTPVTIGNVNNGSPVGVPCTEPSTGATCPCNSEYFVDNGGGSFPPNSPPNVCFGGFTVPLTAYAEVQCGEVYHMKLAIANVIDGSLQSAVFLEGGSLTSTGIAVDVSAIGTIYYGEEYDGEVIIEGCTDATVTITNQSDEDAFIEFIFEGSAVNGVHFEEIPDNAVITVEDEFYEFDIIPIEGTVNGVDSLILGIVGVDPCTGAIDTTFVTFFFIENPPIEITVSDTLFNCPIVDFELIADVIGGVGEYTYEWHENSSSGNPFSNESTPIVNLSETTTYYVTVSDSCGGVSQASFVVEYDIIAIYSLAVSQDTTICIGGTAELWAEVLDPPLGETFTYNWSDPTLSGPGIHPITLDNNQPLVFTVFAQDSELCVSDTLTITINQHPELAIQLSQDAFICANQTVNLSASATGGLEPYSYVWTYPDGSQVSEQEIEVEGSEDGIFCVQVDDACETPTVSECSEIVLFPLPDIDFETVIPQPACYPVEVLFINHTSPDSLIQSMRWSFGNGLSQQVSNPANFDQMIHVYPFEGTYDVTLRITTINGCSDSLTKHWNVMVHGYPIADFEHSPRPATVTESLVNFENLSQDNFSNEWEFGINGELGTSNWENPFFLFPSEAAGEYPVRLVVTNQFGCSDTIYQVVYVNEEFLFYMPNAFTPNGDGDNDIFRPYGVDINYRIYSFQIFNRWGHLLFESANPDQGWDGRHRGKDVPEGVYVWKIVTRSRTTNEKKEMVGHVTLMR